MNRPSPPIAPRRPAPSLSTRLSLLFAAITTTLMCVLGVYLYDAFARAETAHEIEDLHGKAELLRHVAARAESEAALVANPRSLDEVVIGHPRLAVSVYGHSGILLWASVSSAAHAISPPRPASVSETPTVLVQSVPEGNRVRQFRSTAFEAALAPRGAKPVTIVVSLDVTESAATLARIRDRLLVTLVIAAAVGAGFGYIAVRLTLRRFDELGRALRALTTERLGDRLDEAAFPDELRGHAQGYNAMADRLGQSFDRLQAFASDIAHELRTPLNNMLLNTHVVLTRQRPAAQYREALEAHAEETSALARLVDDMLFVARAESTSVVRAQTIDLAGEARNMASFFAALAAERGIEICVRGTATVRADRALIQRVLANLIENAIRHGAAARNVVVELARQGNDVTLSVRNSGPPIPKEHLPRLFDRFYTADAARPAGSGGSGLGLAIVKSIVDLHRGRIEVVSDEHETRFSVVLPATYVDQTGKT